MDMKKTVLGGTLIATLAVAMLLTTTFATASASGNGPAVAFQQTAVATAVATAPAAPTAVGAPAGGTTYSGKVTRTGDTLTINSNNQDRQFTAAPNLVVVRDGRDATFGDLRENDQVNVTAAPDGRATRIEATSASGFNPLWLLPLLLIPLLLIPFLMGRRRKPGDFIVERNTGSTTTTTRPTETTTTRTTTTSDSTADRDISSRR
ncbi:MAG: hypothetical protein AVDCRST_MAG88-4601 [uncultured Thermomicrobiales bacterium]|uniref:DUF5666 domain-containing protein n=1 Tax=uncultured Thermomicrobiales bacterium TaxID=1645740 RepID=A0A6J4VXR8_9BACT|nr:MAG: hypothetical protein AVDCRST_MAG88-4601 [uncultured Thermomicrobiales bacterium]